MTGARDGTRHSGRQRLAGVVRAAFNRRELASARRLRGGSRKGVYRLILDDDTTAIAYLWHPDEDYWPRTAQQRQDPFGDPSGLDLFVAAHATLAEIGVRVPRLIMLDGSKTAVDAEVAVLEDIRGGTLERLWTDEPRRAQPVLHRLGEVVRAMHHHEADRYGRPAPGGPAPADPTERVVLDRALDHLAVAATRVERIAAVRDRLADTLRARHAAVRPRARYGFVHGELGPDHVLVDDNDEPVLIDIEGAMFFDVEWEHAFLELRFAETYRHLAVDGLDADRLRLYRIALYLSLVEGPLRLLDGDFPHRAGMLEIVEQNIGRTLAQLS